MKILFIGDIFGRPGRETVKEFLPEIKKEHKPDLVIANVENISHGSGFTPEHIEEMQGVGVDFFTSGNHVWSKNSGVMKLNDPDFPVIRPANYPDENSPGRGYKIVEDGMMNRILVVNLMGRVFMKLHLDCPFRAMDRILKETAHENLSGIFVDFHAETTSEKYALALYLDGRISAIVGTHTHVPTADYRLLPNETAFMCDAGMTGIVDSVIGANKEIIIKRFLTQMPIKMEPATEGRRVFNAVLIELDEKTKKALNIQHVQK